MIVTNRCPSMAGRIFVLMAALMITKPIQALAQSEERTLVQGHTYQMPGAVFCLNMEALNNMIGLMKTESSDWIGENCHNGNITVQIESKIENLSSPARILLRDPKGAYTCHKIIATSNAHQYDEETRCSLGELTTYGFVVGVMKYREKYIRIYIRVDDTVKVVTPDGRSP